MSEIQGEGRSVSIEQAKPERAKPALIKIGKRWVISTGRWNDILMADYLMENGREEWVKVGVLAGVGCGANTIPNKKRVRSRLSSLFMELRERNLFLAIKYDGDFGAASEIKIADLNSDHDRQNVKDKLKRMKRRKEMSEEQYDKTIALLHSQIC
jgi:hypothetical protein